jgi:hypothetical protein
VQEAPARPRSRGVHEAHTAFDKVKATELRLSLTPLMSRAQQALLETERAAASKDWEAQLKRVQTLLDKLDRAIAKQDTQGAFVLYEQLEEAKKALALFENPPAPGGQASAAGSADTASTQPSVAR